MYSTLVSLYAPLFLPLSLLERPMGSLVEHPVLFVTYFGSNLQMGEAAPTYRKIQAIATDFHMHAKATERRVSKRAGGARPQHRYRIHLLYQRTSPNRWIEPFNCSLHVPAHVGCAEYSRADTKRAFGHEMALHRRGDAPRRLNIGFWICALWMMDREREGKRLPFVWYLEDDVFLPGSWSRFLGRYDRSHATVDLLVPQNPYVINSLVRGRPEDRLNTRGWNRLTLNATQGSRGPLSGAELELAIARGVDTGTVPTQLSIPSSTLERKLPVRSIDDYAKAPLYVWRMSGRLASAVSQALLRGAQAHEEILVPTVCRSKLTDPQCVYKMFEEEDLGIPCGSNDQDAWYRLTQEPSMRARSQGMDLENFRLFFAKLQVPGEGAKLLPAEPQRLYHPVKGQLLKTQNALTLREAGGV